MSETRRFTKLNRTPSLRPTVSILIEEDREITRGRLLVVGPKHALISTERALRRDTRVVLTVTVPEQGHDTTQALFRLSGRVRVSRRAAALVNGRRDYLFRWAPDEESLACAFELCARIRTRGLGDA